MTMLARLFQLLTRSKSGSALAAFIMRLAGSGVTMVMTYLLFRTIGDDQAGLFLLAYSTVVFIAACCGCGVEIVVLRQTAAAAATEAWGEANAVFLKSFVLVAVFASAVAAGVCVFSVQIAEVIFRKPEFSQPLRQFSPAIAALALILIVSRCLQGWRRINSSVFMLNVSAGALFCLALVLIRPRNGADASFWYSVAAVSTLAAGLIFRALIAKSGAGSISWNTILKSAWPVWVMVMVETLSKLVGQFFAGRYATPIEVSQLVLSQRIAMVSTIALVAATQDAAPVIAEAWKRNDIQAIRQALRKATLMGIFLSAPMQLPMLLAPHLVLSIFSNRAGEGAHLLQISAIGQMVVILCGAGGFVLTMSNRENLMRNAVLISGVVAVLGGWVLTSLFGVTGAAISSSLALISMNISSSLSVKKHFGFHPLGVILNKRAR
jgi:O-antigen/teichoic acid export membrane protein